MGVTQINLNKNLITGFQLMAQSWSFSFLWMFKEKSSLRLRALRRDVCYMLDFKSKGSKILFLVQFFACPGASLWIIYMLHFMCLVKSVGMWFYMILICGFIETCYQNEASSLLQTSHITFGSLLLRVTSSEFYCNMTNNFIKENNHGIFSIIVFNQGFFLNLRFSLSEIH